MIVYKNLFPDDFSKLSNKKGLVYEILSKEELINTNQIYCNDLGAF